jgi:uncharacterized protein YgiM (DUF1202 family)
VPTGSVVWVRAACMRGVLFPTVMLALSACSSSSRPTATPPTPSSTTVTTAASPSTSSGFQTSGVRTVLTPGGLNIRAQASKSAAVVGTAAQGTPLTVLAHTGQAGGWFQVKGATVTGWISDKRTLSAPGKFASYIEAQGQFAVLYPDGWSVTEPPPATVVFRAPAGDETVVVTTAATVSQLARGRAGYRQTTDEQVVVCGVTGDLRMYTQQTPAPSTTAKPPGGVAAEPLLAQVHLALDAQHALGVDTNLAAMTQLQSVRDFLSSLKFPFPQCER